MTLEEFIKCAQIQADYLHSRGCHKPKEMIISQSIRKSLNLGSSITLNYVGEVPLIEDPSIPLFMFRGFTYDRMQDTISTVAIKSLAVVEKGLSMGITELLRVECTEELVAKMANSVHSVPISQRKRASR